jgi:PAS domain-containing protein
MKRGFLDKLIDRLPLVQPGEVQSGTWSRSRARRGSPETIFNAILEGVIVTNPEGRILYLNRARRAVFSVSTPMRVLGKPLGEVVRGIEWDSLSGAGGRDEAATSRCFIQTTGSSIFMSSPC